MGSSYAEGADTCVEGARHAAGSGDPAGASFLLGTAAIYRLASGDEQTAVEHAEEALTLARAIGSRSLWARSAGALAYSSQDLDAAAARRAAEEVLEIASPGDFHLTMPLRVLAVLAWRDGDSATAERYARRAAYLIRDHGDRYVQAAGVRQLAAIVGSVDLTLAAELLGVAEALLPERRVIARDELADIRLRADLDDALGADKVADLVARGRRQDVRGIYATVDRALDRIRTAHLD
jgi:hypothetical protein